MALPNGEPAQAMARVEMGGMEDSNPTFQEACLQVENMTWTQVDDPIVTDKQPGTMKPENLPLRPTGSDTAKAKYFIELDGEFGGAVDKDIITQAMRLKRYHELPDGLRPKGNHEDHPAFVMQLFIENRKNHMFIHYTTSLSAGNQFDSSPPTFNLKAVPSVSNPCFLKFAWKIWKQICDKITNEEVHLEQK